MPGEGYVVHVAVRLEHVAGEAPSWDAVATRVRAHVAQASVFNELVDVPRGRKRLGTVKVRGVEVSRDRA